MALGSSGSKLKRALQLIDAFEGKENPPAPEEAERLVVNLFIACGLEVKDSGFVGGPAGADCYIEGRIAGKFERIAVEVKGGQRPADVGSVRQAIAMTLHSSGAIDRGMVIARSGFTAAAMAEAESGALGKLDLFDPNALRAWLSKHSDAHATHDRYEIIIRSAMKGLAEAIALDPQVLMAVEWRDLERILREVFEGCGWETNLTRPGKDGGFDLELATDDAGQRIVYLVEVKHWATQRPGSPHLQKLVKVTASMKAKGGILLSSSGFAGSVYAGIADFSVPVRLGSKEKLVSLCRTYYRLANDLWVAEADLESELLSGTVGLR